MLDGQKDISVPKLESMISHLEVRFDQSALKAVNEICKCNPLEGVDGTSETTASGGNEGKKMQ